MKKCILCISMCLIAALLMNKQGNAQQYKLRQVTNMMQMKMESTIYVKGMRKRTEGGAIMGMGGNIVTIEQCDLKRTIKLNDKKKLYFIEPFNTQDEVVINDDDEKKNVVPAKQPVTNKKGGTIYMYFSIHDTGERKKMYGFTARHVWSTQKIKPSPDACTMKDSMLMKIDGWYIDLPEFNCPVQYSRNRPQMNQKVQPDCMDRFVTHQSGKGKMGFPLIQTTIMQFGGQSTEMTTSIETLEFSTAKLDSMLFVVPPGYQLAASEEELQDKMDMKDLMKNVMGNKNVDMPANMNVNEDKKPGTIRIGVYAPAGSEEIQVGTVQQQLVNEIKEGRIDAVAINNEEQARKLKCDYTLQSVYSSIKPGNKVTGIFNAIRKGDPTAASSYTVQSNMTLKSVADGSIKEQRSFENKLDGRIDDVATKALVEGWRAISKSIK